MHDYLSTKRLRELGAVLLQNISSVIHLVDRDGFGQLKDQGIEYQLRASRGHPLFGQGPSIKVRICTHQRSKADATVV